MPTFSDGEIGLSVRTKINDAITKVDGIEAGSTADQTGSEIKSLYESEADTNAFTDDEKSKVSIAVVSDTTGVTGANVINNVISLTQAEYDAITPDPATLYVITE